MNVMLKLWSNLLFKRLKNEIYLIRSCWKFVLHTCRQYFFFVSLAFDLYNFQIWFAFWCGHWKGVLKGAPYTDMCCGCHVCNYHNNLDCLGKDSSQSWKGMKFTLTIYPVQIFACFLLKIFLNPNVVYLYSLW